MPVMFKAAGDDLHEIDGRSLVAFAGGEEEVGFEAVLAGVEVVVAAAERRRGSRGCRARRCGRASTTRIWSARRMVERRWAMTKVVRPCIR